MIYCCIFTTAHAKSPIGAKSPHQKQKYFSIFFYAQEICEAKDPFGASKLSRVLCKYCSKFFCVYFFLNPATPFSP